MELGWLYQFLAINIIGITEMNLLPARPKVSSARPVIMLVADNKFGTSSHRTFFD